MFLLIWLATGLACSLIFMATERSSGNPIYNFNIEDWFISVMNIVLGGVSLLWWVFVFIGYAFPKTVETLTRERHILKREEEK